MIRAEPSPINMLHWKIGEEMKTTVHIQNHEHLRCKTEISKISILLGNNKASQTYCWREFCDSGNNEPNDTLVNIKCINGSLTQPTRNAMPHLFPEEVPELIRTSTTTAKA